MRIFILLVLVWSIFLGNAQDTVVQNGYQIFRYPDGTISSEGTMRNGQPDGYWKTYYENGVLKSEGNRKNFELDSLWKFYDREGKISVSITYKLGKQNGPRTTYLPDKKIVEYFENNIKTGVSKEYSLSGKLMRTTPFSEGLEDGNSVSYSEDDGRIVELTKYRKGYMLNSEKINRLNKVGQKTGVWKEFYLGEDYLVKSEIPYRNGEIDGYVKYYDEKGNLDNIQKFVNGVLVVDPPELAEYELRFDYYPDGSVKTIGSYKDNVAQGVRRDYAQDGTIISAYILHQGRIVGKGVIDENGQKQGAWQEYFMTGRLQAEGNYTNNVRTGPWKFYFENGNLEQSGDYDQNGLARGEWRWYFPNKSLRRVERLFEDIHQGEMVEYAPDSSILTKGNYVDDSKEGFWIQNVNGYRTEGEYLDDVREGYWKSFYPNGNLYSEGNFIDDYQDGVHVWYYENGKIREKGNYTMGLKDGEWRYFDEEGNLIITVIYKSGIEIQYDTKKIEPEISPEELTE